MAGVLEYIIFSSILLWSALNSQSSLAVTCALNQNGDETDNFYQLLFVEVDTPPGTAPVEHRKTMEHSSMAKTGLRQM